MSFSREITLFAAGSIVSLVAGAILLNYAVMPLVVRHGDVIRVPNVARLSVREAEETLKREGFGVKIGGTRYDPAVGEGLVVAQSPRAKALAKRGRRIYVTISKGGQLYAVPDVEGVSLRQAELQIKNNGLKLGRVTYRPSEDVPKGVIVSQRPAADDSVGRSVPVDLVVSSGPPEPVPIDTLSTSPSEETPVPTDGE